LKLEPAVYPESFRGLVCKKRFLLGVVAASIKKTIPLVTLSFGEGWGEARRHTTPTKTRLLLYKAFLAIWARVPKYKKHLVFFWIRSFLFQ
jgi:hypothetical protein